MLLPMPMFLCMMLTSSFFFLLFSILFFSYKVLLKACLQIPINTFIINALQCVFGYIFIITFFNRVFHAFYTVFRIAFRVVFLIACIVIRFFIRRREDSRSDYFFSCLHSLFLAASSAFATGGGTLLESLF